jgi:hypothetical protein
MQSTVDCIALRRNQPSLDVRRQPLINRRRQSAKQGNPRYATFRQTPDQFVNLFCGVPDDPTCYRIPVVRMTHDQWRETRIVGRRCLIHPGHSLERVIMKPRHHFIGKLGANDALVMSAERQSDRLQSEIGTTSLVGYRKTITPDPDFPFPGYRKADASRSDDDDATVAAAMGSNTGNRCIMGVNNRLKRLRLLHEVFERPFAAHSSEADGGVHGAQSVLAKPGISQRCPASNSDFLERPLDSKPQRGWARNAGSKNTTGHVLNAGATTSAAAIYANKEWGGRHSDTR